VTNAWNVAPWLTPWDIGDKWVSFIAPNDVAASEALATMLFEEMGGEGEVIHITGVPGNTADILRTEGFDRALEKFPGIELVAREPGQFNRGDAESVTSALLTAHPDAEAVFSQNDDMAMGVLAVLAARNIDDVLVTGIDGIPDMLEAIEDGRAFATWAQHGGLAAAWQTAKLYDAMHGVELHPLERMMWLGTFIINTPEAAGAYNEMMFSGGEFPFDYRKMSRALHPDDWEAPVQFAPIDLEEFYPLLAEKPDGYELPAEYLDAVESDGFEAIAQEYADHVVSDPFAEIRSLCEGNGCQDITSN
jgi:ribose transport system substrate-binding protein